MSEGLCRFCGEKKKLIKAHVVPGPFYTHYINPKEKTHLITIDKEKSYESRCPTGFYDQNILCEDCDRKIGVYDQEAQQLLFSNINGYKREVKGLCAYIIPAQAYDYKKLKLFFISVLWRASISSADPFKNVNLEPEYEKLALEILKNSELENEKTFPVFIFKLKETEGIRIERIFIEPIPYSLYGIKMYKFVFAGYAFYIKVDVRELGLPYSRLILRPNSELVIIERPPIEEIYDVNTISSARKQSKNAQKFTERTSGILQKMLPTDH